jgi:hypothetical protein
MIGKFQRRHRNTILVYNNSLIALVSAAEWFLAQLLHQFYKMHPEALSGGRDKVFSLEDLRNFDTLEDARMSLIESKIENILRDSISVWFKCLKEKPFELSLGYLPPYEAELIEITQRRNLLVHNGGIVNSIYMSKVPKEARGDINLGDSIKVSKEYIQKALNIFERMFVLIGAELWKKLLPTDEDRSKTLFRISWKHLEAERWDIAEGISYFIMQDKRQPELDQLTGKINYWQSLKWQDRFKDIRIEVEKEDFSAKQQRFSLAQAALLDDEERFFQLLPQTLKTGEVSEQDLREWPLFRKVRATAHFRDLYPKSDPSAELTTIQTTKISVTVGATETQGEATTAEAATKTNSSSNASEKSAVSDAATPSAPRRPRGTMRQSILKLLAEHGEGLSAEQIRAYLTPEKPIGDILQRMRIAGVVKTLGSGKGLRYVIA